MINRLIFICWMGLGTWASYAQVQDDFSDGDFTQNPTWEGDVADFKINTDNQLQLNQDKASISQLVTSSAVTSDMEWQFYVRLAFAPSSQNYARIYLLADQKNLDGSNTDGYFIQLGDLGSNDGIDLYKQTNGNSGRILQTFPGVAASRPTLRIRVTLEHDSLWTIYADTLGGFAFLPGGAITIAQQDRSDFFGFYCRYTVSNATKFYLDDVLVRPLVVDTVAPVLTSVTAISEHELKLAWSEALDPTAAQDTTNYLVPELGAPQTATLLAPDSVLLTFSEAFAIEQDYHLSVIGTSDLAGNLMEPIVLPFHWFPGYYPAQPFEVVIHEIMADPSPPRDLPDAEYLELRNVTSNVLSLTGYRLEDGTGTTTLPELLVQPDELVILCSSSTRSAFSAFGRAVAVPSFPSLRNDGEPLALRAPDGTLIHAVTYSDEWYGDAQKAEGGWSLEMVDATNPCSGRTNWTASVAPPGGTPGQLNSVAASNPDLSKPQLIRVEALAADSLLLVFNESLDSLSLAQGSYVVQPDVSIARVLIAPLQFDRAVLALAAPLQAGQPYTVTVGNMQDCVGNTIEGGQPFSFLLPEPADSGDIILNEILFDPHPGGVDFVELVNVSEKYLQLQGWRLANVEDEQLANERLITTESFVVAPGQYVLLTPDPALTLRDYPKAASENFLPVASLPAFPNDAGSVVLLSPAGQPWQRFDYDVRDHFTLLDDEEGVSLERIRMEGPVNDPSNWQSAAATAGYATPGYRNSQATDPLITQGTLAVEPAVFTPDQDGDRDVTTIRYQFDQSGFVGTLTLYDDHGRVIRQLARNEILGTEGTYKWDGTQDDGRKARIGIYLVLFEVFLLNGHTEIYRDQVVVGSRF